jgi:leucyl/phenylalanyl-tRNA--protein transferase
VSFARKDLATIKSDTAFFPQTGMKSRKLIPAEVLLSAYAQGIFPMGLPDGEIGWFSPDPRGVIPIDYRFHVPHGLRRVLKKHTFELRFNTAFHDVMRGCAGRDETWIDDVILASYSNLHTLGFAHSVETWRGNTLVGGLYGVALGGAFFGESMFHRETDASKIALCALVDRLREREFLLLDTQWVTPHLKQFGAHEIPRSAYLIKLEAALERRCTFVD